MSESHVLQSVTERGWRSGFANLLRHENSRWWHARRWWVQSLIWFVTLNAILVLALWIMPAVGSGRVTVEDAEASWAVNASSAEAAAEGFGALLLLMGVLPVFGVLIRKTVVILDERYTGPGERLRHPGQGLR